MRRHVSEDAHIAQRETTHSVQQSLAFARRCCRCRVGGRWSFCEMDVGGEKRMENGGQADIGWAAASNRLMRLICGVGPRDGVRMGYAIRKRVSGPSIALCTDRIMPPDLLRTRLLGGHETLKP